MSKYTVEVRYICEALAGFTESGGLNSVDDIIEAARPHIFSFEYPIFDENYKQTLETKFLLKFYTREICEETAGLWRLRLKQKFNEIMPYYNQLYEAAKLSFDPFIDTDITSQENSRTNRDGEATTVATSNDTVKSLRTISDTPQGSLSGVEDNRYITGAEKNDTSDAQTSDNKTTSSECVSGDNTRTTKGKNGGASYSQLLKEYRETFINIDAELLEECEDLFFGLW